MTEADDIVARYVDMWNEPDPERRRQRIAEVWATDGEHHVATLSAVGHPQLAARVNSAHQKWVVEHGYVFRSAGDAQPRSID